MVQVDRLLQILHIPPEKVAQVNPTRFWTPQRCEPMLSSPAWLLLIHMATESLELFLGSSNHPLSLWDWIAVQTLQWSFYFRVNENLSLPLGWGLCTWCCCKHKCTYGYVHVYSPFREVPERATALLAEQPPKWLAVLWLIAMATHFPRQHRQTLTIPHHLHTQSSELFSLSLPWSGSHRDVWVGLMSLVC